MRSDDNLHVVLVQDLTGVLAPSLDATNAVPVQQVKVSKDLVEQMHSGLLEPALDNRVDLFWGPLTQGQRTPRRTSRC